MNRKHLPIALIALVSGAAAAAPVVDASTWTETFDVGNAPSLIVDNIWGSITVERGRSDTIQMSIAAERRADDAESFERSKELIPLRIAQDGNDVFVRVGRDKQDWWDEARCEGCRLSVDLVVRVPAGTRLNLATVNNGDIQITDIEGSVTASNINGSIATVGLSRCERLESINGEIDVAFAGSPATDCHIETLNGDIGLLLRDDANAAFEVSLFNGDMRSGLELAARQTKATVEKTQRGGRNHYDIEQLAGLELGRGGKTLTLKSLNGDVIVERSP